MRLVRVLPAGRKQRGRREDKGCTPRVSRPAFCEHGITRDAQRRDQAREGVLHVPIEMVRVERELDGLREVRRVDEILPQLDPPVRVERLSIGPYEMQSYTAGRPVGERSTIAFTRRERLQVRACAEQAIQRRSDADGVGCTLRQSLVPRRDCRGVKTKPHLAVMPGDDLCAESGGAGHRGRGRGVGQSRAPGAPSLIQTKGVAGSARRGDSTTRCTQHTSTSSE